LHPFESLIAHIVHTPILPHL